MRAGRRNSVKQTVGKALREAAIHFRILESWRLVAALLVMVWHFLRYAPGSAPEASDILYRLLPLMEMFLMISGFLIMMRYGDRDLTTAAEWRRFLMRRFARLYPLYFATLCFFFGIAVGVHLGLIPSNWPGRYDFVYLPYNLLLVQGWGVVDHLTYNYVAWTLSAEWFCYLVFPLLVVVAGRWGMAGLLVLAALTMLALEAATATGVMPFDSWMLADSWGAYRAFADFTLGAIVAVAVKRTPRLNLSTGWAWLAMLIAVAAMQAKANGYVILLLLGYAIYLAAVTEASSPRATDWLKPVSPLGQVSFGIYLIHPVVETIFFSAIWKSIGHTGWLPGYYVYWLLPMAVTIALALLSARYYEKPVGDWLNRLIVPGARRATSGGTA